jgi:GDPmannose 4,6-dehydratase
VEILVGDASKAHRKLGWIHETNWQALCVEMVEADLGVMQAQRPAAGRHE